MRLLPTSVEKVVAELSKLPGVGERSALRYAVALMRFGSNSVMNLSQALESLSNDVEICNKCHFWAENNQCPICEDSQRETSKICVVRDCPDLLALEKFRQHPWSYHVLHGLLSPLNGVGPSRIKLTSLFERLKSDESIDEVILALDATVEGDATSLYVKKHLETEFPKISVSRTALGLPAGASVEYLDSSTLEHALAHRTPL